MIDGKQVLDARPEVIHTSLSESLKRLKTDYVDLYYLHRVDPKTPIELVAQTMKELMAEGIVQYLEQEKVRSRNQKICLVQIDNRK